MNLAVNLVVNLAGGRSFPLRSLLPKALFRREVIHQQPAAGRNPWGVEGV